MVELLQWTSPDGQTGRPAGMAGFHGDGWHLGGGDGGDGGDGGGGDGGGGDGRGGGDGGDGGEGGDEGERWVRRKHPLYHVHVGTHGTAFAGMSR